MDKIVVVFAVLALVLVCLGIVQRSRSAVTELFTASSPLTHIGPIHSAVTADKCIDVTGASTANGTRVSNWECTGSRNQDWSYNNDTHQLVDGNSSKCLDVPGGDVNAGYLQIWDCDDNNQNQKWTRMDSGQIQKPGTSKCIDLYGANTTPGATIALWDCGGQANQKWNTQGAWTVPQLANMTVNGDMCVGSTCINAASMSNMTNLVTGGAVNGRYVKLEMQQIGCMNLGELEVYSTVGGPNVALGKPVTKSSGWSGDAFPGANLVDGNEDTFMHTSCQDAAWALVDLGSTISITNIRLYNRRDCCPGRALGIIISVLDENGQAVYRANPLQGQGGASDTNYEYDSWAQNSYYQWDLYLPGVAPIPSRTYP